MLLLYILNQTSIKSLSQDLLQSLKTKKKKRFCFYGLVLRNLLEFCNSNSIRENPKRSHKD